MDIQLDSNGHILLTTNGLSLVNDRALLVAQRLSVRLRTYLGEWFLDTTMGIDWFADVLLKNVSKQTVDSILQNELVKDRFVVKIKTFSSSVVNRNYTCSFSVEIEGMERIVEMKYLANENNLFVTDEKGNYIIIEV
jgi:hypothetical protein